MNVTPEKFANEFGFRGVQFGNYVEQKKRVDDINEAYDALLDLANLLDVPSRALSLNGSLGIAFGAMGSGGKNPAKAHYEPDEVLQKVLFITDYSWSKWLHQRSLNIPKPFVQWVI